MLWNAPLAVVVRKQERIAKGPIASLDTGLAHSLTSIAGIEELRLHEELPDALPAGGPDEGGEEERQIHPRGSSGEFRREPCRVEDDELRDAIRAVEGDHDREGPSHGVPDDCKPRQVQGVDPRLYGPSVRGEGPVLTQQKSALPLAREIGREPGMEQSDRAGDRQPHL